MPRKERTGISARGARRRKLGMNIIDRDDQNPFDTTADALADIFVFFQKRMGNLTSQDFRNRTRIRGILNLTRSCFYLLPEVRKELDEEGVVIRVRNNTL